MSKANKQRSVAQLLRKQRHDKSAAWTRMDRKIRASVRQDRRCKMDGCPLKGWGKNQLCRVHDPRVRHEVVSETDR